VIVGINNYKKTFLAVYYYIILESAASFKFLVDQLSNLAFYNYLEAAIIIRDFTKGFKVACAAKAAVDLSLTKIIEELLICLLD